jgi:hypothetical protein
VAAALKLCSSSHGQILDQVICAEVIGFAFQTHPLPLRIVSARATTFYLQASAFAGPLMPYLA